MKNLAWKSRTNFLPLILDTFAQQIKADGYIEANGTPSRRGRTGRRTGWTRGRRAFTVRRCSSARRT
jgi:hypothetical protein